MSGCNAFTTRTIGRSTTTEMYQLTRFEGGVEGVHVIEALDRGDGRPARGGAHDDAQHCIVIH